MPTRSTFEEEINLRLLKTISKGDTHPSQPELAEMLGISLGKTNYCITELAKSGYIKIQRFKNSNNKIAYAYLLTPSGVEEKLRLMARFLRRKLKEYEIIRQEIAEFSQELSTSSAPITEPAETLEYSG